MLGRAFTGSILLFIALAGCGSPTPEKVESSSVSRTMNTPLLLQLESDPGVLTVDMMPSTEPRARTISLQFSVANTGGTPFEVRLADGLVRFWAEQDGREIWESRIPATSATLTIAAGKAATFGTVWSIPDTSIFAKDSKLTLYAELVPAGLSTARTLLIAVVH